MTEQSEKDRQKAEDALSRHDSLIEHRRPWVAVWDEISQYCLPRRYNGKAGQEKNEEDLKPKSFDGTATSALQLLADGLQGYLVSSSTSWFKLQTEEQEMMDYSPAREYLQKIEKNLYHLFSRSNFYDSIGQAFQDGGSIGTSIVYIEANQDKQTVRFSPRNPNECCIAENRQGIVDTVYREFEMTRREVLKEWGKENLPDEFPQMAEEEPYDKVLVVHAVFPRDDRDVYKIDRLNKPYSSQWILKDDSWMVHEGGYDSFPYVVWRYKKNSDEVYGRSPAYEALSDILRSQQIGKTMLEAAQLAVRPPLNVPAEKIGGKGFSIKPNAMNPYQDPSRMVFPMNLGGNYPVGRDQEQAVQDSIREHFRVDFFMMLNQMAGENMTATQVMEMQAEKAAILGTIVGRITSEFLDPLFDRVFELATAEGWIPAPPPELEEYAGMELAIDYIGPLAQAQKRFHATQGMQQALNQIIPLMEIFPEFRDHIDPDEMAKQMLRGNGMPETIIRDKKIIEQIRKAQQQQQQMAQAAQMEQVGAESYQKMKDAPEDGSPAKEQIEQQKAQQTMGALIGGASGQ